MRLGLRDLKFQKAAELMGAVTSVALASDGASAFIGTEAGNIYGVALDKLETQLRGTGHTVAVSDVCFPHGTSELFITSAGSDIRVWHTQKRTELLRIQVPNLVCNCIAINQQGTSIVSGWDDGKVRAFAPETGKLQYTINDAHAESVTAINLTSSGNRLITGGRDGRVRVWNLGGRGQVMEMSFKEHKKEVTSLRVSHNDEECISASADGSCLVWNLRRASRANALFASTVFRTILYHPDESQLLTCGSDRKISYWDTTDATAIRVIEGSTDEVRRPLFGPAGLTRSALRVRHLRGPRALAASRRALLPLTARSPLACRLRPVAYLSAVSARRFAPSTSRHAKAAASCRAASTGSSRSGSMTRARLSPWAQGTAAPSPRCASAPTTASPSASARRARSLSGATRSSEAGAGPRRELHCGSAHL